MTVEPISGEIELRGHERTLFRTDDPVEVLDIARGIADALKTALDESGMTMRIGRSEHVLIDGWQTLGSMLGVSAHIVWSRPLPDGDGWEARAEARTVDGRVVGSGEAMVTRAERNWRTAEDYALRSMAQTRAQSKALRGPLGFVVTLAGRNPTPAEEMAAAVPEWAANVLDGPAASRFADNVAAVLGAAGVDQPDVAATHLGQRLVDYCDGTLPAACARLAHVLASTITIHTAPPAPDAAPEPEAAATTPPEPGADDEDRS